MSKYELSVSKDYVPDWGVVEAVRELFQNALDQQTTSPTNTMFFDYNAENSILKIGNRESVLDTSSLLLGSTTKRGQSDTIGQFGEGYKIATLVLSRMGKPVTFFNYGNKEVWRPRFVKSRRYGTEVLTFFIDKKHIWERVPNNNLTITVQNFSIEDYNAVLKSNLHLNKPEKVFEGNDGEVLLDEQFKKKVFVNGLFVTEFKQYEYGYNFKPGVITLDRDRKLVSDFDLKWLASRIWTDQTSEEMQEMAVQLASQDKADVKFLGRAHSDNDTKAVQNIKSISEKAHDQFIQKHGSNSVPITAYSTDKFVPGVNKVVVHDTFKQLLTVSPHYASKVVEEKSIFELLEDWRDKFRYELSQEAIMELNEIISKDSEEDPF